MGGTVRSVFVTGGTLFSPGGTLFSRIAGWHVVFRCLRGWVGGTLFGSGGVGWNWNFVYRHIQIGAKALN